MTPRPSSDQTWQPIDGRVALIAPASAIATDVLEATLRQLEVHGVDYHLGRHVEARYRYLAGTVEQRLEDLHNAFDMPDITAVWCLRGGYGCGQLLPGLDWGRLQAASPRPLIGFSDISVLLSAFHRHGLPAIHGPVATGPWIAGRPWRWKALSNTEMSEKPISGRGEAACRRPQSRPGSNWPQP